MGHESIHSGLFTEWLCWLDRVKLFTQDRLRALCSQAFPGNKAAAIASIADVSGRARILYFTVHVLVPARQEVARRGCLYKKGYIQNT